MGSWASMAERGILRLRPSSFTWSQATCPLSLYLSSLMCYHELLTKDAETCWPALISMHSLLSLQLKFTDLHNFRAPLALNLSEWHPLEHSYKVLPLSFCTCCPFWEFPLLFPFPHHYHPVCLTSPHSASGLNLMITTSRESSMMPQAWVWVWHPSGGSRSSLYFPCCNTSHTAVYTCLWPPTSLTGLSITIFSSAQHSVWYIESTINIC